MHLVLKREKKKKRLSHMSCFSFIYFVVHQISQSNHACAVLRARVNFVCQLRFKSRCSFNMEYFDISLPSATGIVICWV